MPSNVVVTTVAAVLLDQTQRQAIQNLGPSDIWIGDAYVTVGNGWTLPSGMGADIGIESSGIGLLYAVTASGTADVRALPL